MADNSGMTGTGIAQSGIAEFLNTPALKNQINVAIRRDAADWKAFAKKGVAPAGATEVEVWVHSFTDKTVTADFDDFVLVELEG